MEALVAKPRGGEVSDGSLEGLGREALKGQWLQGNWDLGGFQHTVLLHLHALHLHFYPQSTALALQPTTALFAVEALHLYLAALNLLQC